MSEIKSESEFYKWRSLIALAHADGKVTHEETNMISLKLQQYEFTQEQLEQLNNDFTNAQDFKGVFEKVTDEEDRDDLVRLAYTLFWSDGDYDAAEQKLYAYIKGHVNS